MSQQAGRIANPFILFPSVAFVLVSLATTPAFAANKQAQERAARKACLGGDFNKGVNILADLFVSTKDPTYIFNQGRCFEQNHRYEDAISRFEEYLRVPDANLDAADRASAEKHIADCKEKLPEQPAKFAPQVYVPPPPVATPERKPTPESEPVTPVVVQPEREPAPVSSGAGLRIGGIVIASVGIAAVAAGVVFNLESNALINDMETKVGGYSTGNDSNSKTYKTLAWVGYGAGAACLVTGAILYGVGYRPSESSSTSVAILPAFGPGQAGALLTGGF
jgi:hypothetical protein